MVNEQRRITVDRALLVAVLAGIFALGIILGNSLGLFTPLSPVRGKAIGKGSDESFKFIRASLDSDSPPADENRELPPFQYKVNALIATELKEQAADSVSVYFRDLTNGNWFGIGEQQKFLPASEFKLPLMIAYFKWAETNPLLLRKTLTFSGGLAQGTRLSQPEAKLRPWETYTVGSLIYEMLVHNDETAYTLLRVNLPEDHLIRIFGDLDVDYDPNQRENILSLSACAAFFRVLFNASYLSEEMSEKALRYISKASYDNGMAASVPPDVALAARHNIRLMTDGTGGESRSYQLHEFGIIYCPHRPFLLGVVARGKDVDRLTKVLRSIARLTYEEVEKQS